MALAVDSEMPSNVGASASGSITSITYSFTNTAGTYLLVGATACIATGLPTINSVTYAAAAMTKIDNQQFSTQVDVWLGSKVSPATGANNVVANTDITVAVMTSGAISFTGQHATPAGTPAKASDAGTPSSPATVDVTGTTAGNIVVAVMAGGSDFTANSGTKSWLKNVDGLRAGDNGQSNRAAGTGGTVTMTGTMSGSDHWGIVAVEVKAAGAATGWGPLLGFERDSRMVGR